MKTKWTSDEMKKNRFFQDKEESIVNGRKKTITYQCDFCHDVFLIGVSQPQPSVCECGGVLKEI